MRGYGSFNFHLNELTKGQLILKADWRAIDSPKKRTDEFDLFAMTSKKANKTISSVHFLGIYGAPICFQN